MGDRGEKYLFPLLSFCVHNVVRNCKTWFLVLTLFQDFLKKN